MAKSGILMIGSISAKLALFAMLLVLAFSVASCVPYPWEMPRRVFGLGFFGIPLALIGLGIYFIPTIIAAVRRARSIVGIILLNVFLGWTFLGWIGALVWSLVGAQNK